MKFKKIPFIFLIVTFGCIISCATESTTEAPAEIKREIDIAAQGKMEKALELAFEGIQLFYEKEHDKAIKKLVRAKEIVNVPLFNYCLGASYHRKGANKKASESFDETIELLSSSTFEPDLALLALVYEHKIYISFSNEDYAEALENCEQAIFYSDEARKKHLEETKWHLQELVKAEEKLKELKK